MGYNFSLSAISETGINIIKSTTLNTQTSFTINANGHLLDLSEPCVMGILNVTPDSFYAGSRRQTAAEISARAKQIIAEGGKIIDIGAFSTRPGAAQVTLKEELERMRMALDAVREAEPDAILSIDTFRPEVARMAVTEYGAAIINDVSEGNSRGAYGGNETQTYALGKEETADGYPEMFKTVAELGVAYILMSVKPDIMSMMMSFAKKVQQLRDWGAKDIILDPGFGFGKTTEQNYRILAQLDRLREIELPILVGASRKSMIYKVTGGSADNALNGTTVINTIALTKGCADIIRVHDVKECVETIRITEKIKGEELCLSLG